MRLAKLSTKILTTIISLVLLLSLILIITIQFTLSNELLNELQKRGSRVARDIARQGANYLLTNDILNLRILVNGYKRTDSDIAYIFVINRQGEVLVHTFKEGFPAELSEKNTQELKSSYSGYSVMPVFIDKIKFFDISTPILVENIGFVHVGISEVSLKAVVHKTIKLITIIILAALFLVIVTGIALSIVITKPISQLVKVAKAVGKGDLSSKVDIKSRDELGELGKIFNQMTDDLQKIQGQLVQAAKMASIGQLAAGLAHEINNPLTGVVNNVQLIKMIAAQKPDSTISLVEFMDILSEIEKAGLRCKKITQSLLDFSHASKDVFKPVSINELVENTVNLIKHELELQNIVIRIEPEPGFPLVHGNSQLLQQVLMNLITNAQWAINKKSGVAGGLIIIKTFSSRQDNQVYIEVIDTGVGMPEDILTKIFEPFFTTKDIGEGTGLGLSVLFGIIKDHHGLIKVKSQPGLGSTFIVSLPVFQEAK